MTFLKKVEMMGTFKLEDYSNHIDYYVNNFPQENIPEPLGSIESSKTAKEKAEGVWIELYGETIKSKKPYEVSFDEHNQVWMIQGTLPKNWDGGVPHILIRKSDGKVLAIWHDK